MKYKFYQIPALHPGRLPRKPAGWPTLSKQESMDYRNHLSPPIFPASWASSWGEDRFGLWMNLTYQDATLTFRWILPGTFMMGSPKEYADRYNDEDHHEVSIQQGFWLSDTPVTQAFWQSVNGDNPSQFEGGELPVETVSWGETQAFIEKLNQLHPDLMTRLPWEAEWEYACRAGTATAFSFGDEIDASRANYRGVWAVKDVDSYKNDKEWGSGVRMSGRNILERIPSYLILL